MFKMTAFRIVFAYYEFLQLVLFYFTTHNVQVYLLSFVFMCCLPELVPTSGTIFMPVEMHLEKSHILLMFAVFTDV